MKVRGWSAIFFKESINISNQINKILYSSEINIKQGSVKLKNKELKKTLIIEQEEKAQEQQVAQDTQNTSDEGYEQQNNNDINHTEKVE